MGRGGDGVVSYSGPKTISTLRPSNPYVMEYFESEEHYYFGFVKGNKFVSREVDPLIGFPIGPTGTIFTSTFGEIVTASVDPDGFVAVIVTYNDTDGYLIHFQDVDEDEADGPPTTFKLSGAVIHVELKITPDDYLIVTFQEARIQNGQYQVALFDRVIDLTEESPTYLKRLTQWTTIDPADAAKYRFGAFAQIDRNRNGIIDSVLYSIKSTACEEPLQFLKTISIKTGAPTSKAKPLTDCQTVEFNRSFLQVQYSF